MTRTSCPISHVEDEDTDTRLVPDAPRRQPRRRSTPKAEPSLAQRFFKGVLDFVLVLFNGVVWLGLLTSAWFGEINPTEHGWVGIVVMTLPLWIPLVIIVLVVDCFWRRRMALVTGFVMAVCLPSMLQVCPLNIHFSDPKPSEDSWTLMTYNIYDWEDRTGEYPGGGNATLNYILEKDPDIVCLQEVEVFEPFERFHLTKAGMDSLMSRYRTVIVNEYMAFLSKFDAEPIPVNFEESGGGRGDIAGYRVQIGDRKVTIFSVHLRSIGLTHDNKQMYRELTKFESKATIEDVREELIAKLSAANQIRGEQARRLVDFINKYGGENVIVCGDFNDVPCCYSICRLQDAGLRSVWPAVGFGYQWTYNRNRFYFDIDHVLWRGDFSPLKMESGELRSSDHYPLTTTFEWNDKK